MIEYQIELYEKDDYTYAYGDFIPTLNAYIHEDKTLRPAIIIAPGGGYLFVAAIEAYIVAKRFFDNGYQVFVLTYSVNTLNIKPLKLQPLKDISRGICYIRKNAAKNKIIVNQIAACGFSAGGHLVGSLAVHYDDPAIKHPSDAYVSNMPNAVLLCYPLITTGEFGLDRCMNTLLGENATKEEKEYMSLENYVTEDTPPSFLWHTRTDQDVPVENSILFKKACNKMNVLSELLLFPKGIHGMSIATEECKNDYYYLKSSYTFTQSFESMKYGIMNFPEKFPKKYQHIPTLTLEEYIDEYIRYRKSIAKFSRDYYVDKDIAKWLPKSIAFLEKVFS